MKRMVMRDPTGMGILIRRENGYFTSFCFGCKHISTCKNPCQEVKAFEKLADYEDAEEQGLLLRLPCKVGSEVYQIESQCSYPNDCGFDCRYCPDNKKGIFATSFTIDMLDDIGESIFLTREAAENELRKNAEKDGCVS